MPKPTRKQVLALIRSHAAKGDICGKEFDCFNYIAKPDGWTIPKEASAIHGITQERATEEGIPEADIAAELLLMIRRASLTVCHNVMFDKFIARIAMRRFDLITDVDDQWWKEMKTFCTMVNSTNICQLPPTPGSRGRFKFPKLSEAYRFVFGWDLNGAHNAMRDVRATKELFFWLRDVKCVAV